MSKILNELNPEIVKDFSEDKNLEIITDEIITKARERRSEINVLKNRFSRTTGLASILSYNPETGRLFEDAFDD